jgi:hypothetical protein|tara:strand:+ start:2119 stop:2319 length:201 start_codon:yes stop_codon:yes gene_type:complete
MRDFTIRPESKSKHIVPEISEKPPLIPGPNLTEIKLDLLLDTVFTLVGDLYMSGRLLLPLRRWSKS